MYFRNVFVSALISYKYTTHIQNVEILSATQISAYMYYGIQWLWWWCPKAKNMNKCSIHNLPSQKTHFSNRFIPSTVVSTIRPFCRLTIVMRCHISTIDTDNILLKSFFFTFFLWYSFLAFAKVVAIYFQ